MELATCLSEHAKEFVAVNVKIRILIERLDDHLRLRCGFLEDKEEEEFIHYLHYSMARELTYESPNKKA
jgi:hypothetical protein